MTLCAPRCGVESILLDGKWLVVTSHEADRLAKARIEFAYLCDHEMPDGT